jgi:hypothetical protein
MSWAGREHWRGVLADYVQRHTAHALDAAGIVLHDLAEVIGNDYFPAI